MKTKRTSQYANEHGLPRPDSARFEHGGGSRSNTKGEYVALCVTSTASTVLETALRICTACVSVPHAFFSCMIRDNYSYRGLSALITERMAWINCHKGKEIPGTIYNIIYTCMIYMLQ